MKGWKKDTKNARLNEECFHLYGTFLICQNMVQFSGFFSIFIFLCSTEISKNPTAIEKNLALRFLLKGIMNPENLYSLFAFFIWINRRENIPLWKPIKPFFHILSSSSLSCKFDGQTGFSKFSRTTASCHRRFTATLNFIFEQILLGKYLQLFCKFRKIKKKVWNPESKFPCLQEVRRALAQL